MKASRRVRGALTKTLPPVQKKETLREAAPHPPSLILRPAPFILYDCAAAYIIGPQLNPRNLL